MTKQLALAASTVAFFLVVPAASHAFRVTESQYDDVAFTGAGCGSIDTYTFPAPRGAYRVQTAGPAIGTAFPDSVSGAPVARLADVRTIPVSSRQQGVRFAVLGSDNACADPGAYPGGWTTSDARLTIGYRINRRVRFRSYIMGSYTRAHYRPRRILFGSRTGIVGVRWSRWNGRVARGRGTLVFNNCEPNCAQARPQYFRVAIKLSRVRDCGSNRFSYHYTRFAFRFTGAKPSVVGRTYAERHSCGE